MDNPVTLWIDSNANTADFPQVYLLVDHQGLENFQLREKFEKTFPRKSIGEVR